MIYRWLLILKQPNNRLWISTIAATLFAISFTFIANLVSTFFPDNSLPKIELSTLESLLNVIASTMFAVSTFSLSIMVSAFSSASSGATPRATILVVDDKASRQTISSFISAFIYAIIAKTALGLDFFNSNGQFILFISTLIILGYVIFTLIRWVYVLSHLGRLGNTLDKIYLFSEKALQNYRAEPNLGANWKGSLGLQCSSIYARDMGYLTNINLAKLQQIAEELNTYIHIEVRQGELIMPDTCLAKIDYIEMEDSAIRQCFVLNKDRNFDQDPLWGFTVFSEVAQRALSPAINDPGTAIKVMVNMARLLINQVNSRNNTKSFDRLSIIPLDISKAISEGFSPIARDGGNIMEIEIILQKTLASIWRNAPEHTISEQAKIQAEIYLQRAQILLQFEEDRNYLLKKHQEWFSL